MSTNFCERCERLTRFCDCEKPLERFSPPSPITDEQKTRFDRLIFGGTLSGIHSRNADCIFDGWTGRCHVCGAQQGKCKFGDHFGPVNAYGYCRDCVAGMERTKGD